MSDIIGRYLYIHKTMEESITMIFNKNTSLYSRLEKVSETYQDNIAILYGEKSICYYELNQLINKVTNYLFEVKIPIGSIIAVDVKNRLDLIVAILGIGKAGCVFAPFDSGFNQQKKTDTIIKYDIEQIITDEIGCWHEISNINFMSFSKIMDSSNTATPTENHSNNDDLYLYFTSGTTGFPKAILGLAKSLFHFIDWEIQAFGIDENYRVAQFTNPMFDPFLRDVFVPLFSGSTLCIPVETDLLLDSKQLIEWISINKINLFHTVPSLLYTIIQENSNVNITDLKYVFLAGEGININKLKRWYDLNDQKTTIVNLYGPTETTLAKCYHVISKKDLERVRIPAGKAINDTNIYVMKDDMTECDPFEVGEVYINTDYGSKGYYKNDSLNKESFLINHSFPYSMLYKTGDLGRKMEDGVLELLGRIDRQVKIRGVRVELSEIEYLLNSELYVDEAIAVPDEENQAVVLYIKPKENISVPTEDEIIDFLSQRLIKQSVPSKIIFISSVPRKVNGKIEYAELKNINNYRQIEKSLSEDIGDVGNKLMELWENILNVNNISPSDNFFRLGGHSLNLMSLMHKIKENFDVSISLATLFKHPTMSEQIGIITKGGNKD